MKKKPAPARTREVEAFLEMLQAERGASRNTLAAYGADLDNLQTFLARRQQKPAGADTEALRAYLKSLDYVGMTPRTVARRLSVIRQFFRFLLAERMRDDDPASTLDSPKLGRPLPKVLSRAEVDRLIEATRGKEGDGGRMATLLEILYGSGLRVSELVGLPLSAAERDPTMLMVRGKGEKDRMVPLSDPARAAIASWLHVRAATLDDDETSRYLFPSRGRDGPSHAPAFRAAPEGGRARGRHRSGARVAARPAPCLRQPPARGGRRPAQRAADARPCRYRHDANLHARAGREVARPGRRTSIRWRAADAAARPVDRVREPGDT